MYSRDDLTYYIQRIFYFSKPLLSRGLQLAARRLIVKRKRRRCLGVWPIDERAGKIPAGWPGWPDGKQFAFVLMHDVDTRKGHDNCHRLRELEERCHVRSAYYFVPKRYHVSSSVREELADRGFEVGVHGLTHDGTLFSSWKEFERQSKEINQYIAEWNVKGFSSPSMFHNLEWMHGINVEYDISTFDTDPFEPQPDGVTTIFPFIVRQKTTGHTYIELPYTLAQDFSLYVIMQEKDISIWKQKIDWIASHGGMALVDTHPDYMNFNDGPCGREEYPARFYEDFIRYIQTKYTDKYWLAQPRDIAAFMKSAGRNIIRDFYTIPSSVC